MHGSDEIADGAVGFQGVAQPGAVPHAVAVAAAFALSLKHAAGLEFGEDFQDGALGDADLLRKVADAQRSVGGEGEQHVGMIRQECPGGVGWGRGDFFL